jgi:hypothetical protein
MEYENFDLFVVDSSRYSIFYNLNRIIKDLERIKAGNQNIYDKYIDTLMISF